MSTPKKPNSSLNDEDMHALFHSGDVDVPAELDSSVLAAAREAVELESSTEATSIPGSVRWSPRWAQGLATVAVLVLGIVLVPMMIPSQNTALDMADAELTVTLIESEQLAPALVREAATEEQASSQRIKQNKDGQSANQKARTAAASSLAPKTINSDALGSTSVGSQPAMRAPVGVDSVADSDEVRESAEAEMLESSKAIATVHRESPEAWVEEILRLFNDEDIEKSREEFTLFMLRYPNHELMSEAPKEIR